MPRYRLIPPASRFTIQTFATGMLSFLGHNPTFAVHDFTGWITAEASFASLRLELTIQAATLELMDRAPPGDRNEIQGRMRNEVLETNSYPEIAFQADGSSELAEPNRFRVRLVGVLSLHGIARRHQVGVELRVFSDGIRLAGQSILRMSEYRIAQVTALAGGIRLKDEVKVSFDLAALTEEQQ